MGVFCCKKCGSENYVKAGHIRGHQRYTCKVCRGKSLTFPELADRVSDDIYSKRLSITNALKELPLGNRAELSRWRNEVKKTLEEIDHERA